MVLNNAFVLIQVNKLTRTIFVACKCLAGISNVTFQSWLAIRLIAIFLARYSQFSFMAGCEFYIVKSTLLGVKSGYFFPKLIINDN